MQVAIETVVGKVPDVGERQDRHSARIVDEP
jgi:hypothetical protein